MRHLYSDAGVGSFDLVPAICALDYTMSESGGASQFVRKCTLANGDSYCDCGYKRKEIPPDFFFDISIQNGNPQCSASFIGHRGLSLHY